MPTATKKIDMATRVFIAETVYEILNDPDRGLELKPSFIRQLKESIKERKSGKHKPLARLIRKYRK